MDKSFRCKMVSWDGVYSLAWQVARKIREANYKPDIIIALARGGLMPARALSDILNVKDLAAVKVEHWGVTAQPDKSARLKYSVNIDLTGKNVLVVDDITDTGESMIVAMDFVKTLKPTQIKTATLQHITSSKHVPDFYAEELKDWTWIIYPWNLVEDLANLSSKVLGDGEKTFSQLKDELKDRFFINVENEELMMALENLDGSNKIAPVNKNGDIFWKLA